MFKGTELTHYRIKWIENGEQLEREFPSFEKAAEFAAALPEKATKIQHEVIE